jgi:glycosyltransferase involved in cell wall biosynthesis
MALRKIVMEGFTPDIIIGHVGWGEMSFFREVLPDTPMIGFFEYYYSAHGGPVGFDPSEPVSDHSPFLLAANNVVPLANINIVDLAHSPTQWQCDRFPTSFHDKMYVCHDGIRTDKLRPNKRAKVTLGCVDRPLTVKDEIVTFMARNLETTRGYQQFMRALPHIQKARPNARIMVIGGNDASYGKPTQYAGGLRGKMEAEVGHLLDWDRLHFLGQAPFESYQEDYPDQQLPHLPNHAVYTVLVISGMHGKTGLLVNFFDVDAIGSQVVDELENPRTFAHLGPAAREHVVKTYDFQTICLPEHIRQINALVTTGPQIRVP